MSTPASPSSNGSVRHEDNVLGSFSTTLAAPAWNTFNLSLVGADVNDAQQQLLGLPLVVTNALTDSSAGLVVDRTEVVSAVGSVQVAVSEHRYFDSDSVALRCVWRFGHTVPRGNGLGKFTVAGTEQGS